MTAGVLLVLGILLLGLAVPRAIAGWMDLEARPAINTVADEKEPTKAQLLECVTALESAIQWTSASLRLTNLASCEFSLARQMPADAPERRQWLARAEQHLLDGLHDNPMDGFAWARLAAIRSSRGAPGRQVIEPLVKSLEVEPNNRQLWAGRTGLVLTYAWQMTPEELFALRRHLQTIWTHAMPAIRAKLVENARQTNTLSMLIWSLADDEEALAEFQRIERQQVQ